ncbi:GntR family transcriptional regulator [Streptomyces sp. PKU-EA00015]|uniref:GntR family transcriptional regulator n=1 Tax=Streptomyces sp. PKU-EA00015 TaxID=2748326 RepID=UPI0028117EBB|nr:GntR family transcriptional regulator [Streptomyces sp. PKU-EA00015]
MTLEHHAVNGAGTPSPDQVADALAERIRSGRLKEGERIPTQGQLVEEFKVERRTVRQAQALLRQAGLITGGGKGAPARVASPHAQGVVPEEPQETVAVLGPRVIEAFEVQDVRIDAICLTTETLNQALAEPLRRVQARQITPQSIRIRVLVPARSLSLAFPRPAEDSVTEDAVHEHWLTLRNRYGSELLKRAREITSRGIDVDVTLRTLPVTPIAKLYLLNGSEALFAFYNVARREEQIAGTPSAIYDTLGAESMLFPFELHAGRRDEAFVQQSQAWFDSLWGTLAEDNIELSS